MQLKKKLLDLDTILKEIKESFDDFTRYNLLPDALAYQTLDKLKKNLLKIQVIKGYFSKEDLTTIQGVNPEFLHKLESFFKHNNQITLNEHRLVYNGERYNIDNRTTIESLGPDLSYNLKIIWEEAIFLRISLTSILSKI